MEKENDTKPIEKIDVPIIENPTKSNTKRKKKGLRGKKKAMIGALVKRLGVIKYACSDVGINRTTHYSWYNEGSPQFDPVYKQAVDDLQEDLKDVFEAAFIDLAMDKNPQVVIKAVTTKCKDRGYGESVKQEIEHSGKIDTKLELEIIEVKKDEGADDSSIQED